MGLFKSAKKRGGPVLVVDIGSASIGAAFTHLNQSGKAEITSVVRHDIEFQAELNFKRFLEDTIKSLESTLHEISAHGHGHPGEVHCFLSSPWYAAQTRVIHYDPKETFEVTQKLIDSLIEKEVELFETEQKKKHSVILGVDNHTIETRNMLTSLNGYKTASPVGHEARQMTISIFMSITSEKIMSALSESVHEVFHKERIIFHTLPFAGFSTLRDLIPDNSSFLLCDIGGEITDILVAHNDIAVEVNSFPLGRNFLLRSFGKRFAASRSEGTSIIKRHQDGDLSEDVREEFETEMGRLKEAWLKSLKNVLDVSTLVHLLPEKIYIVSSPDLLPTFEKFISDPQLASSTISNKPFTTIALNRKYLREFVNVSGDISVGPAMMLETIFLNRLLGL